MRSFGCLGTVLGKREIFSIAELTHQNIGDDIEYSQDFQQLDCCGFLRYKRNSRQ